MKYKDAHKIPLLNEELLAINGSWGKRASVLFTGVHHTPVDDPTPRYIPAVLMRLNGLKKKKRHEAGREVLGMGLGAVERMDCVYI